MAFSRHLDEIHRDTLSNLLVHMQTFLSSLKVEAPLYTPYKIIIDVPDFKMGEITLDPMTKTIAKALSKDPMPLKKTSQLLRGLDVSTH